MLERPARGVDVGRRIEQRQQLEDPVAQPRHLLEQRLRQQRVGGQLLLAEQVVVQRQEVEVAARFLIASFSIGSPCSVSSGMLAPQPLERRHDLVADEAVALLERGDEHVHRLLRRDLRQRAGMWRRTQMSSSGSRRKNASESTTGSP